MKIKTLFVSLLVAPLMAFAITALSPAPAYADCADDTYTLQNGANCSKGEGQQEKLFGTGGVFKTITDILLFLIGAISVIMLIYGGIRYTISGGDSGQVTSAKNTIMYAVIGIIVALLAYAVVNFVIDGLKVA